MQNIKLRLATDSDIDSIMDIEKESFIEAIQESVEVFVQRIKTFSQGFIVFEQSTVFGYMCCELWDDVEINAKTFALNHDIKKTHCSDGSVLYISSFAIKKEFRGKGLGNKLFLECINKLLMDFNIKKIVLLVNESWQGAINIYKKNGFVEYSRLKNFFCTDDKSYNDGIIMTKIL